MNSADHHREARAALRGGDAVKKQNDLRALAQHRDRDHDGKRRERLRSGDHRFAGGAQFGRKLAAVPRHPHIMPREHEHGEAENGRVEHLLATATEQVRKSAGKDRDQASAEHARCNAARDPTSAAGNP